MPRDRLEAAISNDEYDLRQRDYGIADGVAISCDVLSTWLYDDDAATLALSYTPIYAELRRELDGTYFEDLLRDLVLESDHNALVELIPTGAASAALDVDAADAADEDELNADLETGASSADAGEAAELAAIKASLTLEQLQQTGRCRAPARPARGGGLARGQGNAAAPACFGHRPGPSGAQARAGHRRAAALPQAQHPHASFGLRAHLLRHLAPQLRRTALRSPSSPA